MESKFFQEKRNILFTLEDGASELFSDTDSRTNKSRLVVNEDINLDISEIDNDIYKDVFKLTEENLNIHNSNNAELEYVADLSDNEKQTLNQVILLVLLESLIQMVVIIIVLKVIVVVKHLVVIQTQLMK